ncbi:hypothetical protein K469DRAFT_354500 [Zopfia rhizophila CBS 207.26]|uniref:Uncharacterized protein n=1 Tax=Zopfia rhizophila CBS 207.26 TaxID=1314779 RepID=A0A6A6DHF5_9PEZI|nr:hypothetical protein K469DRAFT_354500 [Zopfia rhizophila CBS 207.26]
MPLRHATRTFPWVGRPFSRSMSPLLLHPSLPFFPIYPFLAFISLFPSSTLIFPRFSYLISTSHKPVSIL